MHQISCEEESDVPFTTVCSERNLSPCEPSIKKETFIDFWCFQKNVLSIGHDNNVLWSLQAS
jgi:hypothetical protein